MNHAAHDDLINSQLLAGVSVNDGVSPADVDLNYYLEMAHDFIKGSSFEVSVVNYCGFLFLLSTNKIQTNPIF